MKNALTNRESSDFFFKSFNYDMNLPIDAFPLYAEKIWGVIKNHKDLNLPSQKVMVSNLRCSQIKLDALELIKGDFVQLKAKVSKEINHNFGEEGKNILDRAMSYFIENAKDYSKEVFQEKSEELHKHILNELFLLYDIQIQNLKKTLYSEFSKKLDKIQMEKGKVDQVIATLKADKAEALHFAQSVIYKSVVVEHEWTIDPMEEIKQTLENQEKGYIEKLVTLFVKMKESQIKKSLTLRVNNLFDMLDDQFWVKVRQGLKENMENSEKDVLGILKGSFEMNESLAENYMKLIADEVYASLEYEIAAKASDLTYFLFKKLLIFCFFFKKNCFL